MKTYEILQEAKNLIDTPDKWTKGKLAANRNNEEVDLWSNEAVCFCAVGAIRRVHDSLNNYDGAGPSEDTLLSIEKLITKRNEFVSFLADYNDHILTNHEVIMSLFDEAIEVFKLQE